MERLERLPLVKMEAELSPAPPTMPEPILTGPMESPAKIMAELVPGPPKMPPPMVREPIALSEETWRRRRCPGRR